MSSQILQKPFHYGKITLPSNLFYAPLAGCSDYPFRKMGAKHGKPGLMYCEMVKMDPLVRRHPQTLEMLAYDADMHPIGAQICGSKLEFVRTSAQIAEELGFDTLDLNCGCPVDKVTKDGSGSALLKNPQKIGEIIKEMVDAVKIPVSVKIRAGWDDNTINVEEVVQIAEAAGAVAITIHGRTRAQGYHGPAKWEYIRRAKEAAKNILVIGNGDLYTPEDVIKMHAETGCDGFLFARGTMGAPWIAQDVENYLAGTPSPPKTIGYYFDTFMEHLEWTQKTQDPLRGVLDLRRVGAWYIKGLPGARHFRGNITRVTSYEQARTLIAELKELIVSQGFDLNLPYDASLVGEDNGSSL